MANLRAYMNTSLSVPNQNALSFHTITNTNIENMCIQWQKAHRRVLGFYKSISTSDNNIVKYTAKCKLYDHSSTLGKKHHTFDS